MDLHVPRRDVFERVVAGLRGYRNAVHAVVPEAGSEGVSGASERLQPASPASPAQSGVGQPSQSPVVTNPVLQAASAPA